MSHKSIPGGAMGFAQQTPAGQRQMFGTKVGGKGRARRPRGRVDRRRSANSIVRRGKRGRYYAVLNSRSSGVRGRGRRRTNTMIRRSRKPRHGTKAWMSYIRGLRKKSG